MDPESKILKKFSREASGRVIIIAVSDERPLSNNNHRGIHDRFEQPSLHQLKYLRFSRFIRTLSVIDNSLGKYNNPAIQDITAIICNDLPKAPGFHFAAPITIIFN